MTSSRFTSSELIDVLFVCADIIEALSDAIPQVRKVDPLAFHRAVRRMYNWHDVARRTELVYDKIMDNKPQPLLTRLRKYGTISGNQIL